VALGPLRSNPFPDATPEFFRRMEDALSLGLDHRLRIRAPFLAFSKPDILRLGRNLPLDETFSCMAPADGRHCGVCGKCEERRIAFRAAGVPDRTDYAG
jgi:7-cyano-7-deazaguanine synthase